MKMRIFLWCSLFVFALSLTSCEGSAAITPSFYQASSLIRTSSSGVKDTITLADSLRVGDTVRMGLLLNGYYDYLTSFVASADTANVRLSLAWGEELSAYLAADADPEHGKLTFAPDCVYVCVTTLTYVPRKSGRHEIDLLVTSNAPSSYSRQSGHFFIAVK